MLTLMDRKRALPIIALATLLAVDIVLVLWALWPAASVSATGATPPAPSPTVSGSASASASASPSPSASPTASPTPISRVLVAVDRRTAWLATTGTCEEPGQLQVTTDGGATWTASDTPAAITRIRTSGRAEGWVVAGVGKDCTMRVFTTGGAGDEWSDPASASAAWARVAEDARRAIRPGGGPVTPCGRAEVLDLASIGRVVASVLCADGTVRTTEDGGETWPEAFRVEGALAFALRADGRGTIASVTTECDGTTVTALVDGQPEESVCVEGAEATPGDVSISLSDQAAWLVAGDAAFTAPEVTGRWVPTKGALGS